MLGFDNDGGFWLVHSVPRFPVARGHPYEFPVDEHIYGQTFLCFSFGVDMVEQVATQYTYNRPWIYDSNMPASFASQMPILASVIAGKYVKSSAYNILPITSNAGMIFKVFAKTATWGKNLYADLVAPTLQSPLQIETWMRPFFGSLCSGKFPVEVVDTVQFPEGAGYSFKYTKDHSKWAVVSPNTTGQPWLCIGDINHQLTQQRRAGGKHFFVRVFSFDLLQAKTCFSFQFILLSFVGGCVGTVCFQHKPIYTDFVQLIQSVTKC